MTKNTIKKGFLFSDGGARGNPGSAGAGVIIADIENQPLAKISEYLGALTNNQAEYQALILGLRKALELEITDLTCYLDSELVVKQLQGNYKVKQPEILNLHRLAFEFIPKFRRINFISIPREKNFRADKLVNQAINKKKKEI